jgi:hypothetical protein
MRARGIALLLVLSLSSAACASRRCCRGPARSSFDREAETKAVYVAVLKEVYAKDWLSQAVEQFVVDPDIPAVAPGGDELVRMRSGDVRRDTLADFERPRPAGKVPADLAPGRPVRWFTDAEFAALPGSATGHGWPAFHDKFPLSGGHITLSQVGFSSDGTEALVYPGRWFDSLGGSKEIVRLRKVGGVWRVTQRVTTMIS